MPYISVNSFKQGLDARRSKLSAQQGSLVTGRNVHVNRGGELENRKAFVKTYELTPGRTFGLHATSLGLYVFGSDDPDLLSIPAGIRYQRLRAPGDPDMTEVVSVDTFYATPYVVARFADGTVHHFYNGVRVTDWDIIAPAVTDLQTLGQALADLVNTDAEVSASYALEGGTPTVTITALVQATSIPINASVVNAGGSDNNSASVTITQAAAPATAQEVKVALNGSYDPQTDSNDVWEIAVRGREYRLTGAASGVGSTARVFHGKVYATVQGLLYFSDTQNPMRWVTSYAPDPAKPDEKTETFAGFESVASQTSNADNLVVVAPYQNRLAIFSRRNTQVWTVVPGDPVDNVPVQILDNIGTMAPRSAVAFGELDVFFLSDSGIRSLRARDASNAAAVYDVGTSIDPLVRARMATMTDTAKGQAVGIIEPTEGRYLLAIGPDVFVHSYYPASGISAWTTYDLGFSVSDWAVRGDRLFARSGDSIYLYGGTSGEEYDNSESLIELSWLDADKPAHEKLFNGLDVACDGVWTVELNTNPNSEAGWDRCGYLTGENFSYPGFRLQASGTHAGLRFRSTAASFARLSAAAIHFEYSSPPR